MAKDKKFMMTDEDSFNSQMRLEGRIFTNSVNRSVVVQILSGHEVKYRERIINGLRTREWGWVYEKKKRNVDRLRFQKGLLFLYQSNQCSPCKAFLSVVAGYWHGTFVGLKKLSHQSTETTNTTEDF